MVLGCFPGKTPRCDRIDEMGNGTIYKRGGAWYVNFKTAEGKRVRESIGPSKKIAERVLSLRMTQVLENRYFPASKALGRMPFNEFAQMYIDRVVPLLKSVRTERNRVASWVNLLGTPPLGQITRAEIEVWRRDRMATCKPATVNRDLSRLRRMLNIAVEWDLLEESPMEGMKFLRENNARTRYLSIEECQRLIASCIAPYIRAIVTVALHSGMRLGEILNLHWRDIDFQAGFMLIRDSKNGEARPVPMDKTLTALFTAYPRRPEVDLVFAGPTGHKYTDIRVGFRNACDRAGITDFRFHDCRHSYASHFIMAGEELATLQRLLGHKGIAMTLRYSHLSPSFRLAAIDRMNNLWQSAAPMSTAPNRPVAPTPVTTASQTLSQDSPAPA
jgi:integrase